jgi:hypothetical protein
MHTSRRSARRTLRGGWDTSKGCAHRRRRAPHFFAAAVRASRCVALSLLRQAGAGSGQGAAVAPGVRSAAWWAPHLFGGLLFAAAGLLLLLLGARPGPLCLALAGAGGRAPLLQLELGQLGRLGRVHLRSEGGRAAQRARSAPSSRPGCAKGRLEQPGGSKRAPGRCCCASRRRQGGGAAAAPSPNPCTMRVAWSGPAATGGGCHFALVARQPPLSLLLEALCCCCWLLLLLQEQRAACPPLHTPPTLAPGAPAAWPKLHGARHAAGPLLHSSAGVAPARRPALPARPAARPPTSWASCLLTSVRRRLMGRLLRVAREAMGARQYSALASPLDSSSSTWSRCCSCCCCPPSAAGGAGRRTAQVAVAAEAGPGSRCRGGRCSVGACRIAGEHWPGGGSRPQLPGAHLLRRRCCP